jgi:uracil-DNA glycosylase
MHWKEVWDYPGSDWSKYMGRNIGAVTLQTLWEQKVKGCTRCRLSEIRSKIVFGTGYTERPDLAFVGLGPGVDEDRVGLPFIGRAGELLNRMIEALGYTRKNVYVCNVLSCRSWDPETGKDVDPDKTCLDACTPVWVSQLITVRPRVIIALGAVAGNQILNTDKTVTELRKKVHTWRNTPVQVTYHPAGILRNTQYKRPTWQDLQTAMEQLQSVQKLEIDNGPLFARGTNENSSQ